MRVLRQFQRVGGQAGDGRRVLDADLDEALHPETACGLLDEQQILSLDPAHRTGELPGEQLDDDLAAQLLRAFVAPRVVVGEDLVERLGRHQIADLLHEVAVEGERPRHEVRNVATDQHLRIGVARHHTLQRAAEVGDADPQHRGVERHIDAGHQDERPLAAADLAATLDLFLECLEARDGTGDGVLRAAQVEVHDLQKFTSTSRDIRDEVLDVGVGEVDLRGPDRGQPVVGPALRVARHDVVHLRPAVENHLEQRGQLVHAGHARQRGVLADGVTARDRVLDEGALLTHLRDLRRRHRRHRDLGELRQVQHALGMVVVHARGDQAGRVVTHDVQHREAQGLAGELVRDVPDLAGGLGARPHVHPHALGLDALAREGVDGLGSGQLRRRGHHEFAADLGGHLDDLRAAVDADPVDAEFDLVSRQDHAQEAGRPAHQARRRSRPAVGRGDRMLGGGREPHPVHDGGFQTGEQCRGPIGVDRVVVARDDRERAHVDRGGDDDVATAPARGVGRVVGDGSAGARRVRQLGGAGPAPDREPLLERGQGGALGVGDRDGDGHDTADLGVGRRRSRCGDGQFGLGRRHRGEQVCRVIQVDQAQQPLDDGEVVIGDRGPDGREHRGPAQADQGVGHQREARRQRGAEGRGDTGVVGDLLRVPFDGDRRGAVDDGGKRIRAVHAGGDRQHGTHGLRGVLDGDDRHAAVDRGRGQREADRDPDVGQRNTQRDRVFARAVGDQFQPGPGVRMGGTGLAGHVVDLPLAGRADAVHRVDRGAAGPQHVGRVQHDGQRSADIGAGLTTGHHRHRLRTGGQHAVDDLLLEPVEQVADRLVEAGDAGDGLGAGDDAHLIGGVAGVVRLPQGVAAPPATHVLVDDGHEVDRLARLLAQRHEERQVGRVQPHRLGVRVAGEQRGDRVLRIVEERIPVGAEQRVDRAEVLLGQPRLGALEHVGEAVPPGHGQPGAARSHGLGGAVAVADSQVHVALQPLQVGHIAGVTEVRLGRGGHRRDDLVAPLGDGVGITGDLVEQAPAARRRVVDLVNVGAQLATATGHSVDRLAGPHPGVGTSGLDQHLLDRGRGGGLLGGHRRGADQDAVHRHGRETVVVGPGAGQIVGGALGGADATADADGDVAVLAQIAVGGQQQIVEVFPGVVSAGAAALDVDDHVARGHLVGDLDDRLDLVDRPRLEGDVGDADGVELLDEVHGLFEVGDAGGDDDAVDRRPGLPGLLHQPLAADLQLPQIGIEEQRVELHGTARLEQLGQLLDAGVEDLLGHLTAAGELGPVSGVGRRGNDLGVDGGGRHAREQDRRAAGEAGELRRGLHLAVGQGDRRRCVARPGRRHIGRRADGEQAALPGAGGGRDDADAQAADHRGGQPGHGVARTQVDDPLCARGGETFDLGDPVDGLDEDVLGEHAGEVTVETGARRPLLDQVDSVGQPRGVEADLDVELVEHRAEDGAAARLVLALGLFSLGDLLAVELEAGQLLGRAGDDHRAAAVTDGECGGQDRAHVLGELVEELGHAGGVDVGHRDHRRFVAATDHAASAGHQRARRTDQLTDGQQLGVARAAGLQRLDGGDALGVPGDGDRRVAREVEPLALERPLGGHLRQQDAGAGDGCGGEVLEGR
ncbi:hypothetical protein MCHUDSM44219_02130 [Mycolicibacterium chubuense]|uniref:Uncharacterized protein n=1 Tax=Mycolicibacterium chubuense TaxID=1800 RepID=A0A0J6WBI7_MYCCU|nr:hypothetical protein MCHUDSM44219_02130 [Mycolicibacterium chubuense]